MLQRINVIIRRVTKSLSFRQLRILQLYHKHDYLDAYARHTDLRVSENPHAAVGGKWNEIGEKQFNLLRGMGLQPHHALLDLGCGTLRGGRHFIRYLDVGHYTGMDISTKAIESGRELLRHEGLEDKVPRLLVNRDLMFRELEGQAFDFILAQSVFTHLQPEHIEECFDNLAQIMHADTRFFFTFRHYRRYTKSGLSNFGYPWEFFLELSNKHGFAVADVSRDYHHPRRQTMAMLQKK